MSLHTGRRPDAPSRRDSADVEASTPLPLVVAGAIGGAAAAALAIAALSVVTLAAWMLDPAADLEWTSMLEVATGAFLAGQGVPLAIDGVVVDLHPWGFAVLAIGLLVFFARWAGRASATGRGGEALAVAATMAVGYGAVAALSALLAHHIDAAPLAAFMLCGALALVVSTVTLLRSVGLPRADGLSKDVRDMAAAGVAGAFLLLAAGALAVMVALLLHLTDVGLLLASMNLQPAGALLVTVLTLGYLPTAVVWGTSYLLGPGFEIASGSVIGPLSDAPATTVPGLPLLAALPSEAPPFGVVLPIVSVGIGAVVGLLIRRRGHHGVRGAGIAAGSALVCAALMGLAAWLATGGLGAARLATLGPAPLAVGSVALATVLLGAWAVVIWSPRAPAIPLLRTGASTPDDVDG